MLVSRLPQPETPRWLSRRDMLRGTLAAAVLGAAAAEFPLLVRADGLLSTAAATRSPAADRPGAGRANAAVPERELSAFPARGR